MAHAKIKIHPAPIPETVNGYNVVAAIEHRTLEGKPFADRVNYIVVCEYRAGLFVTWRIHSIGRHAWVVQSGRYDLTWSDAMKDLIRRSDAA